MAFDATRSLRGALAGTAAAAIWAAQQPLDQRAFGLRYDDIELLGKWLTRGDGWRAAGVALHLGNGALFGALYANLAPRIPVAAWARGPLAGLFEHVATWPGTVVVERLHPARDELPRLWGSGRAFAQSAWRHVLFGAALGELERRLNPPLDPPPPLDHSTVAGNGHGSIEHLVVAGGPG